MIAVPRVTPRGEPSRQFKRLVVGVRDPRADARLHPFQVYREHVLDRLAADAPAVSATQSMRVICALNGSARKYLIHCEWEAAYREGDVKVAMASFAWRLLAFMASLGKAPAEESVTILENKIQLFSLGKPHEMM